MAVVRLADVIVPEIYVPYKQRRTMELSRLVQSGVIATSEFLNNFLAGPGLTVHAPAFRDLENDAENISNDDPAVFSTPNKITTEQEIAVRLSRNQSWSSMDLVQTLIGPDPMNAIGDRVAAYWTRAAQRATLALLAGVFADNDAAPTAGEHVQGDLTLNISGSAYAAGVTDFNSAAFLDALQTMGDAQGQLGMIVTHSVVHTKMKKLNLIDFIPDARGEVMIPTYMGKEVVIDDGMPNAGGVFQTMIFGAGAIQMGAGSPPVPAEIGREAASGNGGGQDILYDRVEWSLHPGGHAYVGTPPMGGPSNANTTNNLANAGSWQRRAKERKMIPIARLITREF